VRNLRRLHGRLLERLHGYVRNLRRLHGRLHKRLHEHLFVLM
jgi:hypothetical protein